jgi:hypothetical protein
VPADFNRGVLIPLLKGSNLDSTKCENYRGITLCNTISKILEKCLLRTFQDFLYSDQLQFGFKKKRGCNDAIFTLKTVVDFYTENGSTISACTLDLAKAFDKINIHGLLLKLMERELRNVLFFFF